MSVRRVEDLVMDVGMHTGEDTERFLAAGRHVVAIEANPDLVKAAERKFAAAIQAGRLKIVAAAIAERRGTAAMGISDQTIWSSLNPEMIARNEKLASASYRYIDVETIPFEDVVHEFGVPHYLKVDIEGYDMLCVRALRECAEKPAFVSLESNVSTNWADSDAVFDELAELWTLGYRRFRYVNQAFGDNEVPALETWDGPSWSSALNALRRAQLLRLQQNLAGFGGRWTMTPVGKAYRKLRPRAGWYDLHAAL